MSASETGRVPALVYHLEDDPLDAKLIAAQLSEGDLELEIVWIRSAIHLFERLERQRCDLILLDYRLRGDTGLEVLEALADLEPPPVIVLSGEIGEEYGVECLHAGAVDYVLKDRPARLGAAIRRALAVEREKVRLAQLEDMLRQRERLESLGLLAGSIAHDFNNILGGLLNLTEAAAATLPPEHPAREYLHQTQRVGSRAASLTRRLLAYSRNQPLEPKLVNLNAMVEETLELFSRLSPPEIEVELELATRAATVKVDPGQLQHVILNLCLNARDSLNGGGTLTLRTSSRTLPTGTPILPAGSYAQLEVEDTGCGIPADQIEHVFSPFFTTKGEAGTGLGLASALGTVSQSGGTLQVSSTEGVGTTFTLLLPEIPKGAESPSRIYDRAQLFPSERHRVLLVEDDDLVRELARDYLTALGYRVVAAATGSEAVAALESREEPVDALVADVVMPDLSGREVAHLARGHTPGCQVVYTSGYSRESIFEGKVLAEGETFVQKPVRLATLASILKETLE